MSVNRARPRKGAPARAPRGRPRRAAARTVPPKRPLSALRLLLLPGSEPLDLLGERHQAPRLLDMQPFDQPAVDERNAKTPGGRLGMRGDDLSRPRDLVPAGGEGRIGRPDLLGMDQRLAVKSELPALPARKGKTLLVAKVKMDAIEHPARGRARPAEQDRARSSAARARGLQRRADPWSDRWCRRPARPPAGSPRRSRAPPGCRAGSRACTRSQGHPALPAPRAAMPSGTPDPGFRPWAATPHRSAWSPRRRDPRGPTGCRAG